MHVLAIGQIVEEDEQHDGMNPPEDRCQDTHVYRGQTGEKHSTDEVGNRHEPGSQHYFMGSHIRENSTAGNLSAVQSEEGNHQHANEAQDDESIRGAGIDVLWWEEQATSESQQAPLTGLR